jgi:hypothetical protein
VILTSNDHLGKQVQGKQGNKHLALTLACIYHPCTKMGDNETYLCFLDTLDALLNHLLAKSELIMGADINVNIGKPERRKPINHLPCIPPMHHEHVL